MLIRGVVENNGKEGTEMDEQSVDYGNWVPKKMLITLLLLTSLFGAATLLPLHTIARVLLGSLAHWKQTGD